MTSTLPPESAAVISALVRALVKKLEVALDDTNSAVDTLSDSVLALCAGQASYRQAPSSDPTPEPLCEQRRRALCALQFHDRLAQRVHHVCGAMTELADRLAPGALHDDVHHWRTLVETLYDACTSEQDKQIFEQVLAHTDRSKRCAAQHDSSSDVEIF